MRDFENDPITNNSGKATINHPSTINDGPLKSTNVNPSKVYSYNPISGEGTNYGLAEGIAGLNPNPSDVYVPGQSWGSLMSGYVVEF
jgi:hypothetical protein